MTALRHLKYGWLHYILISDFRMKIKSCKGFLGRVLVLLKLTIFHRRIVIILGFMVINIVQQVIKLSYQQIYLK